MVWTYVVPGSNAYIRQNDWLAYSTLDCKTLAPIYEQLADHFQPHSGKVQIAKVDADGEYWSFTIYMHTTY